MRGTSLSRSTVAVVLLLPSLLSAVRPSETAAQPAPSQELRRDPARPFRRTALVGDLGPLVLGALTLDAIVMLDRHHGPFARGAWSFSCGCADVELGYAVNLLGEGAAGLHLRGGVGIGHLQATAFLPAGSVELRAIVDWEGVALMAGGGLEVVVDPDGWTPTWVPRVSIGLGLFG